MNKQSLQFLTGAIITESKMPKDSKKQLLNFVEGEATEHQLMSMLLDGEVKPVSEDEKDLIEDRFTSNEKLYESYMYIEEAALWNVIKLFAKGGAKVAGGVNKARKGASNLAGGGVLGLAAGAATVWAAWRGMGALLNKDKRKCGVLSIGSKRKACLLNAQANNVNKKIGLLNKLKSQCGKSKSPESCAKGINNEIGKLNNTLSALKQKQAKILTK